MKLTQKTVVAITLPEGKSEHIEWDLPGFGFRLRRGGARTWIYQYKIATQNRKITLGNPAALSPARARKAAVEIHAKVRLGHDPGVEKAEGRARAAETMDAVLQNFLTFKRGHLKPRSMIELERHLMKSCKSLHGFNWPRSIAARLPPKYQLLQMKKVHLQPIECVRRCRDFLLGAFVKD